MERERLSPMEYTVLGIAWKRGPCTTYALMKELASSTSTFYKMKAGTAYPLVDRLIRSSLLVQGEQEGTRGEKLVAVTPEGEAALLDWLSQPIPFSEVANTVDFVRLRVFYLAAATPAQRRKLLDDAQAKLADQLAACEKAIAKYQEMGDLFSELATLGVVHETKARIEWLSTIRSRALNAPASKPR